MLRTSVVRVSLVAMFFGILMMAPGSAVAQTATGTIAGAVTDTTGGVLPGATVEVRSTALIEGVRAASTDGAGLYQIIALPPGEYTVTFGLPGFRTVIREDIRLTTGFTANVDAELDVGAVEETITVSGQSPLVDVQQATQQQSLTRDVIDEVPSGRSWANYVVLIPGVITSTVDVGGSGATSSANPSLSIHGSFSQETPLLVEGMSYSNLNGVSGSVSGPQLMNTGMIEEVSVQSSGITAEVQAGGLRPDVILKQGANQFSTAIYAGFSDQSFYGDNIDAAQAAQGFSRSDIADNNYDVTFGTGGAIVQDKLWFYFSYRTFGLDNIPAGAQWTKPGTETNIIWEPDLTRLDDPPRETLKNQNFDLRLTWQTTEQSKLSLYANRMPRGIDNNGLSAVRTVEATSRFDAKQNGIFQANWTWAASNRLLVEIGQTYKPDKWTFVPYGGVFDTHGTVAVVQDVGTGIRSRASTSGTSILGKQYNGKASVSYVTGSHNFKVGTTWLWGIRDDYRLTNPLEYRLSAGVPYQIRMRTTPFKSVEKVDANIGIYAQEQYTLDRLTANVGVRFDSLKGSYPEQYWPGSRFVGERRFAGVDNLPNWKDVSPRLGVTYDVFGTGRTALKWSLGKYMESQAAEIAALVNPMRSNSGSLTTRSWTDTNGNLLPDCVLENFAANGECGAIASAGFGSNIVSTRYDPKAVNGWGTRGYNWELMAGIEHELLPNVSVDVSFHRRSFGNLRLWSNDALSLADFDKFSIVAPTDSRLSTSGQTIDGYYDVKPEAFSRVPDVVIQHASNKGDLKFIYTGVDASTSVRLPGGTLVSGGFSVGRRSVNMCGAINAHPEVSAVGTFVVYTQTPTVNLAQTPRNEQFCNIEPPYQTQVKFLAVIPLPYGLQTSAAFQSYPFPIPQTAGSNGVPGILATGTILNAAIQPSLGRPLAGGASRRRLELIPAGSLYGDRLMQLDWRFARNFQVGRTRIQPQLDIYNLFNDNAVIGYVGSYGGAWQRPRSILPARTFRLGVDIKF